MQRSLSGAGEVQVEDFPCSMFLLGTTEIKFNVGRFLNLKLNVVELEKSLINIQLGHLSFQQLF